MATVARLRCSVNSVDEFTSTWLIAENADLFDDFEVGAIHRLMVNATSSAVKASPLDHFTFGWSLKRQVFRSSEGSQLAASRGCVMLSSSTTVRNSMQFRNTFAGCTELT